MIRKPILLSISVLALVAFLYACSCGSGGPKYAARRFLVALKTHDFEKAKCMVSNETAGALNLQIDKLSQNKPGQPSDIKIISVDKGDTRAKVTYTDLGEEKTIEVVKTCGEWRPVFQKEFVMPDSILDLYNDEEPAEKEDDD